jgi:hypothetical protein
MHIALGVPLDTNRTPLQLPLPGGSVGVRSVLVACQASALQRPLEAFTGDLDCEDSVRPSLAPIRSGTSSRGRTA